MGILVGRACGWSGESVGCSAWLPCGLLEGWLGWGGLERWAGLGQAGYRCHAEEVTFYLGGRERH